MNLISILLFIQNYFLCLHTKIKTYRNIFYYTSIVNSKGRLTYLLCARRGRVSFLFTTFLRFKCMIDLQKRLCSSFNQLEPEKLFEKSVKVYATFRSQFILNFLQRTCFFFFLIKQRIIYLTKLECRWLESNKKVKRKSRIK